MIKVEGRVGQIESPLELAGKWTFKITLIHQTTGMTESAQSPMHFDTKREAQAQMDLVVDLTLKEAEQMFLNKNREALH